MPHLLGQKGHSQNGETRCGKGSKIIAVAGAHGLPIAIHARRASPADVILVRETLEQSLLTNVPERLIADRAYDSDGLADSLTEEGIELKAAHKSNRVNITQDGRNLCR